MAENYNPLNLRGIEFTEFVSKDAEYMHNLFTDFGFSKLKKHNEKEIYYYNQLGIHILFNQESSGFSHDFTTEHGPAISSMGWRVDDAQFAHDTAVKNGAKSANESNKDLPYPAIYGIGDSLIYFIEDYTVENNIYQQSFTDLENQNIVPDKGFYFVDHLTNNVYQGTMEDWANFYKNVFGFTEVRYFDIKGQETALISYALRSPDGSFCIPINEGKDDKNNQIDEYLDIYKGPGVQHLAFATKDIVKSLDAMEGTSIETLDIIPEYYDTIYDRVPYIKEDHDKIKHHQILIDGSKENNSYLLQIFTKNIVGPIFIELIQREEDLGFGEGNFTALFESIERDQMKRGVL